MGNNFGIAFEDEQMLEEYTKCIRLYCTVQKFNEISREMDLWCRFLP